MPDNYDSICSICGKLVDEGTLYYCCPECHRIHKQKNNQEQVNKQGDDKDAVLNTGSDL